MSTEDDLIRDAIKRHLDSRRSDPDFMARLAKRIDEDALLLARIAAGEGGPRIDTSRSAYGGTEPQTWAVVVLDDGSEVRMRSLGDRVEVRTWDKKENCRPPALEVERIGPHVIDVRIVEATVDK